jgi:hypothetical protein
MIRDDILRLRDRLRTRESVGDCAVRHRWFSAKTFILARGQHRTAGTSGGSTASGKALGEVAGFSPDESLQRLSSAVGGLTPDQVEQRPRSVGRSQVAQQAHHTALGELILSISLGVIREHRSGFVPLPPAYWIVLCLILPSYVVLTHVVKTWFIRRLGLS